MKTKSTLTSRDATTKTIATKTVETKLARKALQPKPARPKIAKKKSIVVPVTVPSIPEAPRLSQALVTTIMVKVDVGLGNALFIRGEGAGLSWEKGEAMQCVDATTWIWSTSTARDKIVFKVLINDQVWAQGEDGVAEPGEKTDVAPTF